jgi:hypothetical protein
MICTDYPRDTTRQLGEGRFGRGSAVEEVGDRDRCGVEVSERATGLDDLTVGGQT